MKVGEGSMPAVALFLEGTIRSVEALQRIVSGLQNGGRRVYVFAAAGSRSPKRPGSRSHHIVRGHE